MPNHHQNCSLNDADYQMPIRCSRHCNCTAKNYMRVTCAFSVLLFLLYIKNVPLHTFVKIRLSTDACVLYHTVKPPLDHAILNNSFSHLGSWSKSWQMSINFSKTVIMSFTRHFYYGFNNVSLRRVIRIEVPYRYRFT